MNCNLPRPLAYNLPVLSNVHNGWVGMGREVHSRRFRGWGGVRRVEVWGVAKGARERRRPTGLRAQVRNRGRLENRSHVRGGPEDGVSRWRRPNSDIYSQNHHFGLVYDISISWHRRRQRIISLVCFANNAIHPWPQVMPIFDREMPPGFTSAICLPRNFVYISNLENQGDKSVDQNC